MTKGEGVGRGGDGGSRRSVWKDPAGDRFFLIPDAAPLSAGDLEIASSGRRMHVDPAAISGYEITRQEAKEWATKELRDVVGQLRDNLLGPSAGSGSGLRDTGPEAGSPPQRPGRDLLAEVIGVGPGELEGSLGDGLRRYFADIGATVGNVLSGDPARIAAATARMDEWTEALGRNRKTGARPAPSAGGSLAPGQPVRGSREQAAQGAGPIPDRNSAQAPQGASAPVDGLGDAGIAGQLRAMADAMRRRADALAAAREAAVRDASPSPDAGPSNASDTTGNNPTEGDPGRG